jgi:hypothetical protein
MCNLYSITRNQAAIRDLFKVTQDNADMSTTKSTLTLRRAQTGWF